jgi:signal transduction histidine kinase
LFKRFLKVFELAYRRYLDIEKAEAQARESQIQLALERVRARTMAMQKSEELKDVVHTLFERLKDLDIEFYTAIIILFAENSKDIIWWLENKEKQQYSKILVPYADITYLRDLFTAREKGRNYFSKTYSFEEKNELFHHLFSTTDFRNVPEKQRKFLLESKAATMNVAIAKNTGIHLTRYNDKTFSEDDSEILKRFVKVFEQAYTRFLDLQKAEAQAREAEIEASLERVRGKALAMHKTEDINGAVAGVFEELDKLDLGTIRCGIARLHNNNQMTQLWTIAKSDDGNSVLVSGEEPVDIHPLLIGAYNSWQGKKEEFSYDLADDDLIGYYKAIGNTDFRLPENLQGGHAGKMKQYFHAAFFDSGGLFAFRETPFPSEAKKVMKRFAGVFNLTYKRFLDLQKAEAQAREAQIEAALERVRSRSMAMHKSEELSETAEVLFEQFNLLGNIPDRIGIGTINEESKKVELWVTDQGGNQLSHEFYFSLDEPTSIAKIYNAWKEGKDSFIVDLTDQNLQDWLLFVKENAKLPIDETKIKGRRVQQSAFFSHGFILLTTHEPVADEIMNLLVRFAKVFDQTYRRFLDLQKAEAQTREAIKQASLDRVRGQIASMRSTEDLQRITPLIWHELTALNVPFIRCGVLIIDETKAEAHIYLSSPDGHSLAAMNLPIQSNTLTANSVEYWRKGMVYREHWDKEAFSKWTQSMIELGQVRNSETYQGASQPPESLDLHFVPFTQGMLYVGNTNPLSEESIDLVKSLAEAFSIAYARYEDFTKLEKAKQNVEATLTELKATQTQLIQSEKMASLGELTAGIAHEIQNPLNFVNNFSEVNTELIDELKNELATGNQQLAMEIADDIKSNEEKINHHGKRADAIVKGMLQHSRSSTGAKEPTDINDLADEYLRLSYHGLRAKDKNFNAEIKTDFDASIGKINIIPQDIGRVLLNLFNNAFYAVNQQINRNLNSYEPKVAVSTKKSGNSVLITVSDNGGGIPENIKEKIFQPFFTTKPTGSGTGLGLSLSYDIVKAHGGNLSVETKEGEGTTLIISLPLNKN